jgi:hypothetical protein
MFVYRLDPCDTLSTKHVDKVAKANKFELRERAKNVRLDPIDRTEANFEILETFENIRV